MAIAVVESRPSFSQTLTFELSGRQRQDARARLAKMYRVPPTGPWWPAVGAPLERGVRPLLAVVAVWMYSQRAHGVACRVVVREPPALSSGDCVSLPQAESPCKMHDV